MTHRSLFAVGVLLALACGSRPSVRPALCGSTDFQASPYDHIIEYIEEPFAARAFRGRLKARPTDVEGGILPPGMDAWVQLHGPNGFSELIKVEDDSTFVRDGLPPGRYCFKVSVGGFRSVKGQVSIDPQHADVPVEITVIIAE